MKSKSKIIAIGLLSACLSLSIAFAQPVVDGYKGIWFTLGQFSQYGDKYSGGLGTYTAKHIPMAVYAKEVDKTFFVYGGTRDSTERKLLCMVGCFDHRTGSVVKPVIVYDKGNVDDPHDNPTIALDEQGYIWVFISGRGTGRPGILFKSRNPHDIDEFDEVMRGEFTYPQPKYIQGYGFLHLFTKYTGLRELYFNTSRNGSNWMGEVKLAGIKRDGDTLGGHYQISGQHDNKVAFFFNWHPNGDVDRRTNIYYLESTDFGQIWQTVSGLAVTLPVREVTSATLVKDYFTAGKNVYIKDVAFDNRGNPIALYLVGKGHQPGPDNGMKEWRVTYWDGAAWRDYRITESDHNYDTGSLFVNGKKWHVVIPDGNPPQQWAGGGEVVIWKSRNNGRSWRQAEKVTTHSRYNHNYVRKVVNGRAPFEYFWADGNPNHLSRSALYFGDLKGNVWKLPYEMRNPQEKPVRKKDKQ